MNRRKKTRIIIILFISCSLFMLQNELGYASFSKVKAISNNTLGTSTHLGFYFNLVNEGKAQLENPASPISWGMNQSLNIDLGNLNRNGDYIGRLLPNLLTITNKSLHLILVCSIVNGASPTGGVKLSNLYSIGLSTLTLSLGIPSTIRGAITLTSLTPVGTYSGFIKIMDLANSYSMLVPIQFTVY